MAVTLLFSFVLMLYFVSLLLLDVIAALMLFIVTISYAEINIIKNPILYKHIPKQLAPGTF